MHAGLMARLRRAIFPARRRMLPATFPRRDRNRRADGSAWREPVPILRGEAFRDPCRRKRAVVVATMRAPARVYRPAARFIVKTGRTSTEPNRALGILAAIAIASSRSLASMR